MHEDCNTKRIINSLFYKVQNIDGNIIIELILKSLYKGQLKTIMSMLEQTLVHFACFYHVNYSRWLQYKVVTDLGGRKYFDSTQRKF